MNTLKALAATTAAPEIFVMILEMRDVSPSYETIYRLFVAKRISNITIFSRDDSRCKDPLIITAKNLAELLPAKPNTEDQHLAAYVTDIIARAIERNKGPHDVMWASYQALKNVRHNKDLVVKEVVITWLDHLSHSELLELIERWKRREPGTFPPPPTPESE